MDSGIQMAKCLLEKSILPIFCHPRTVRVWLWPVWTNTPAHAAAVPLKSLRACSHFPACCHKPAVHQACWLACHSSCWPFTVTSFPTRVLAAGSHYVHEQLQPWALLSGWKSLLWAAQHALIVQVCSLGSALSACRTMRTGVIAEVLIKYLK